MNNFTHKKIGIWGFGVVGKSAHTYFDQYKLEQICILNDKPIDLPISKNKIEFFIQNEETIHHFLENNDYILVSPGIPLHNYQSYQHKFIAELDLFYKNNKIPTIAITGSLGKTSITYLLSKILEKNNINAVAAGNIGYPMLNLITPSLQTNNINYQQIVLELSSFQLQQATNITPDIAVITNVYDNHLDHHKSSQEYFDAKCNIFKNQHIDQITVLPFELLPQLREQFTIKQNWVFFSPTQPSEKELQNIINNIIYYCDNKIIYKKAQSKIVKIFDISQLPSITFDVNWLVIITILDLQNINLCNLTTTIQEINIPQHRLQKIASWNGSFFYNDSKSTVWQATLKAVDDMDSKPIKLFLGGLSKGADRTPLLESIQNKNIEIYAFGKEANIISEICKQYNINYYTHQTIEESFKACMNNVVAPSNILFSPAGSSYDLFENYIHRGLCFVKLVDTYIINHRM